MKRVSAGFFPSIIFENEEASPMRRVAEDFPTQR